MHDADIHYKKLILICVNEREGGMECCAQKRSVDLYHKIKVAIAAVDPEVRVSQSKCLGNCSSGVTVVIMPDDIWLGEVTEKDIPEIIKLACET